MRLLEIDLTNKRNQSVVVIGMTNLMNDFEFIGEVMNDKVIMKMDKFSINLTG